MKTMKVISRSQLPTNPPIIGTIVILLVLDRFKAPQAVWGAAFVILLLYWIIIIFIMQHQEGIKLKNPELKTKDEEDEEDDDK